MSQTPHIFAKPTNTGASKHTGSAPAKEASLLERQMVGTYYQQGKFDQVETCSRALTQRYPKDAFGWKLLGVSLKLQGRDPEALKPMQTAAKLAPMDWECFVNLGSTHLTLGNLSYAEACFERVLELNPNSLKAMDTLGDIYRREGKVKEALAVFRKRLSITPDDGHTQHMVAMLAGEQTARAPADYVSRTFDVYADNFDEHLTQVLGYQTPQQLKQALEAYAPTGEARWDVLDLGCGTGLVGEALAPWARHMVGVDLSAKMLDKARAREVYQTLTCADLLTVMRGAADASQDLIVAGDVFVYLGQLDEIVAESKRVLRPQGLLAFSVEVLKDADDAAEYRLQTSGRYSQSLTYLDKLASSNAFNVLVSESVTLRTEHQQAIAGQVFVWRA